MPVYLFVKTISFLKAVDISRLFCHTGAISEVCFFFSNIKRQRQAETALRVCIATLRLSHDSQITQPWLNKLALHSSLRTSWIKEWSRTQQWPPPLRARVHLSPMPMGTSAGRRRAHQPRVPSPQAGTGKLERLLGSFQRKKVCVSACACAWLLPDCVFMCNWIGTISTCTAVLTNDLHVQLVCAWARARAISRERGGHPIVKYWKPFYFDSYL